MWVSFAKRCPFLVPKLPLGNEKSSNVNRRYFRARLCFSGSQAPFSLLLATDC
jgi:hypothetical protein